MKKFIAFSLLILVGSQLLAQKKDHIVKNLKITILSTMLAQGGMGEWGFSALVEADSVKILFDTSLNDGTVLANANELGIDLSAIQHLILSHNHGDHTNGWNRIRNEMKEKNKKALSITHVAPGFFDTRVSSKGDDNNSRRKDSVVYTQGGGKILMHSRFEEVFPGVYLTGPVPRVHPEKNFPPNSKKRDAKGNIVSDDIPEDMSMIFHTEKGYVLLSGCGHSGIINTITYTTKNLPDQSCIAAIGGFHLMDNADDQIKWTAQQLKKSGVRYFMGAHCTGIEPVYQIREWAGLKRGECIVGSVGATFDLVTGFTHGPLTR
jgi:7,8-dihydropterin-6-yl-methyl-4-(beta-D-ribofuranosyl)aminobenzene 5'-phosphate synthase